MTPHGKFWLHVPLETTPGMQLSAPPDRRLIVLGLCAQLLEREPYMSFLSSSVLVIKQWLLFDPLLESDAQILLGELRQRLPVVSMNDGANFRIPDGEPAVASNSAYDGSVPTLIPAHLKPAPVWDERAGSCCWEAKDVLELALADCSPVTDDRLLGALELYVTSQYDFLPRSLFLAKLTILDGLAIRTKRNSEVASWIDEKRKEAEVFGDSALSNALLGLKFESHGVAIRALVRHAVLSLGGSEAEATRQARAAGRLYKTRSDLAHESSPVKLDQELGLASQLTRLVLNAAVSNPTILDVDTGEAASVECGRQLRARWIAEADAAIRKVMPDCTAVVNAIRRPLVQGQFGALIVQLADGCEWRIHQGVAELLCDEEVERWASLDESFGAPLLP
ncbi:MULTISPECIES: hypothetical protein [unclassified Paraburkholderia]|uniref:hypothetical protein n=1 Tax=unclassified Paraburkholderia TaxID=2615204 RepID=UPI002AB324AD|nr:MULTISPECIES: hypothetical protein [unclassified Paraburkholderia]